MAIRTRKTAGRRRNTRTPVQPAAAIAAVAALKGKLVKVSAVAAKTTVPKIPERKRIHLRRLIPRVPTGEFRNDAAPSAALALHAPLDMVTSSNSRRIPVHQPDG